MGLQAVVVEPTLEGDAVVTGDVEAAVSQIDPALLLCVVTTTSCFAPRTPDRICAVSQLCSRLSIPHVINNAYGLQCSKICHEISESLRTGRVDAIVQSTDKNFMVPVGGAVIASPSSQVIDAISSLYPGRASAATSLDFFITMLEMGVDGYERLLAERKSLVGTFAEELSRVAAKHGERVLSSPGNTISFAVSLTNIPDAGAVGAKLFARRVSGTRVVTAKNSKEICGHAFRSYGASYSDYPTDYITAACAVGLTQAEFSRFISRFDQLLAEIKGTVS